MPNLCDAIKQQVRHLSKAFASRGMYEGFWQTLGRRWGAASASCRARVWMACSATSATMRGPRSPCSGTGHALHATPPDAQSQVRSKLQLPTCPLPTCHPHCYLWSRAVEHRQAYAHFGHRGHDQSSRTDGACSEHLERAQRVADNPADSSSVGCNGHSHLVGPLEYLDYAAVRTLPISHALLYGVVKTFLRLILGKVPAHTERLPWVLPHKRRHILVMRGKEIVLPGDFGRSYTYDQAHDFGAVHLLAGACCQHMQQPPHSLQV